MTLYMLMNLKFRGGGSPPVAFNSGQWIGRARTDIPLASPMSGKFRLTCLLLGIIEVSTWLTL